MFRLRRHFATVFFINSWGSPTGQLIKTYNGGPVFHKTCTYWLDPHMSQHCRTMILLLFTRLCATHLSTFKPSTLWKKTRCLKRIECFCVYLDGINTHPFILPRVTRREGTSCTQSGCVTTAPPSHLSASTVVKLFNCLDAMGLNVKKQSRICGPHIFNEFICFCNICTCMINYIWQFLIFTGVGFTA